MAYLLNLVYAVVALLAAPWLIWAAVRRGKYREGWSGKLLGGVPRRHGDESAAWFHAVSVGEVNLLQSVLAEFRRQLPDWQCIISTTTKT